MTSSFAVGSQFLFVNRNNNFLFFKNVSASLGTQNCGMHYI